MPYTIYVVEDHPVMREAYASVFDLEDDLDLVGSAGSAEEAFEALTGNDDPPCDLVVTDYRLPGMTGADLVRHLRARFPTLCALVVSGYEDEAFAREARDAGAAAFLRKRDLIRTLVPTIHDVLDPRATV